MHQRDGGGDYFLLLIVLIAEILIQNYKPFKIDSQRIYELKLTRLITSSYLWNGD